MPRFARFVAVAALGALMVMAPAGAATASGTSPAPRADLDDFEIESFHSDYFLTRDAEGHAQLRVVETIVAVYPSYDQNKGFYRDIPEYRHGVQLHTDVESVVDEFNQPVPYTTEYYEDFYSVGLGDDTYVHGRQTYIISYTQVDVVEAFADTGVDEFYWDVNGTGWAQPFQRVSMTLWVEPSIAAELTGDSACYVRSGTECDEPLVSSQDADGAVGFTAASEGLIPNESLTFSIAFTAGTFEPGDIVVPPPSNGGGYTEEPESDFWATAAPLGLGGLGLVISWMAGGTQLSDRSRRTRASDIIVPQYTPPDGVNVMVAAYIAGRPERAFAAQIVSLAVRGNVRLLDHPDDSDAAFEVQLLTADGLDALELQLARAMFGPELEAGRRIPLGASNTTLGSKLTRVYKDVDRELKTTGMRGAARPTGLWTVLVTLSVLVTIASAIFTLVWIESSFALGAIATGVAFFSSYSTYSKRSTISPLTERGRETNDYLLGMRDYMELAEEDRIRMLQSPEGAERVDVDAQTQRVKLYEKLLPFAVIFGIEEDWAKELTVAAAAARVPVTWWTGSSEFSAWRLNSTINNLRLSTPRPPEPVVARTKSSSSESGWGGWGTGGSSGGWSGSSGSSFSGGSSGGGFSGGGGGGGGGRGR